MSHTLSGRRWSGALLAVFAGVLCLLTPPASAAELPDPQALFAQVEATVSPACGCQVDSTELTKFVTELENTSTVEAAREKAWRPAGLAMRALDLTRRVGPVRAEAAQVRSRLLAYQAQLAMASTPSQVGQAFRDLVSADDAQLQEARRHKACDFTTGELVVIIIGLILGILPGIILLILLC